MITRSSSAGTHILLSDTSQPYKFRVAINPERTHVTVQAKDNISKDCFGAKFSADDLRSLGFFHTVKGFAGRLKLAVEGDDSGEVKGYYRLQTKSKAAASTGASALKYLMKVTLEEKSRYDDESEKYTIVLPQLDIKDTVKLGERLEDVASVVSGTERAMKERLEFVVAQVKQKFDREKERRLEVESKLESCEGAIKKLHRRMKELSAQMDTERQHALGLQKSSSEQMVELHSTVEGDMRELHAKVMETEQTSVRHLKVISARVDEMSPKLARLQARKMFGSEEAYIEYLVSKMNSWDAKRDGPILVRVHPHAEGKAKRFIGFTGEPVSWTKSNCNVKWFKSTSSTPETIRWASLYVFLPLSAFYCPECPHSFESPKTASAMQL